MEYLDLLDKDRNLTGERILRANGKPNIPENKYINIINIFIQNNNKEFLIQKTSQEKGSVMATTGGFVKFGDTSIKTVIIEVQEELGLNINENEFQLFKSYENGSVFLDVYYMKKDIKINDMKLQKEEVEYVKWLSIDEIKELIKEDKFRKGNITPFLELIESELIKDRN